MTAATQNDDGMAGMYAAAQNTDGDPDRAVALTFRMAAVAIFLRSEAGKSWQMPNRSEDGGIFAEEAVFAAGAVQPLVEGEDEFVFETESFVAKVLELVQSAGRA